MKGIILALFGAFALASSATVKSASQETCAAEGSESTLLEHEECDKFYICSEGKAVAMFCPVNLYYNDKIKACDWQENVDCGNRIIKEAAVEAIEQKEMEQLEPVNDDPSKAKEICAAEGSDGTLVAHEDCTKFYICSQGEPVTRVCSNSLVLYYNPQLKACDWPEKVVCASKSAVDEDEEQTVQVQADQDQSEHDEINADEDNAAYEAYEEKANEICAAENSDGKLVAHGDCDKFYKCWLGKPFTIECPQTPKLLYDPEHQYCEWAEKIDCGDRKL